MPPQIARLPERSIALRARVISALLVHRAHMSALYVVQLFNTYMYVNVEVAFQFQPINGFQCSHSARTVSTLAS